MSSRALCNLIDNYDGSKEQLEILKQRICNAIDADPIIIDPLWLQTVSKRSLEIAQVLVLNQRSVNYTKSDESPLHKAIHYNCKEIAALLISNGANIEATNKLTDQRPLHIAAEHDREEMISLLLDAGAQIDAKDRIFHTPLQVAALHGHCKSVALLTDRGAAVDIVRRPFGLIPSSAVYLAVRNGCVKCASILIAKGANINERDFKDSLTPLLHAAKKNRKKLQKLLIDAGADVNATIQPTNTTALHLAVKNGHKDLVAKLVNKGADLKVKTYRGETALSLSIDKDTNEIASLILEKGGADVTTQALPIHMASTKGNEAIVSMLLEKGADIEAKHWDGRTALHCAALEKHENVVRLLLDKGANVEAVRLDGTTPIFSAISGVGNGNVALLIERGANIEATTQDGETPLLFASRLGSRKIVIMLLEAGANAKVISKSGRTPLMNISVHFNRCPEDVDVLSLLLDKGADIDAADKNQMTCLHLAIELRKSDIIPLLLQRGACTDVVDKGGKTPLHYAANKICINIVRQLLEAGADVDIVDKVGQTADKCTHDRAIKRLIEEARERYLQARTCMRNATSAAGADDFHEDDGVVDSSEMGALKRARTEASPHHP